MLIINTESFKTSNLVGDITLPHHKLYECSLSYGQSVSHIFI